ASVDGTELRASSKDGAAPAPGPPKPAPIEPAPPASPAEPTAEALAPSMTAAPLVGWRRPPIAAVGTKTSLAALRCSGVTRLRSFRGAIGATTGRGDRGSRRSHFWNYGNYGDSALNSNRWLAVRTRPSDQARALTHVLT